MACLVGAVTQSRDGRKCDLFRNLRKLPLLLRLILNNIPFDPDGKNPL